MTDLFTNPTRFIREDLPKIVGSSTSLDVLISTYGNFLCQETGIEHPLPGLTIKIVVGGYGSAPVARVPLARSILQPLPEDRPPLSDFALFYVSDRTVDASIACVRRYREHSKGEIAVIACECVTSEETHKLERIAELRHTNIVQYAIRTLDCGAQDEMGKIKKALESAWRERLRHAHAL